MPVARLSSKHYAYNWPVDKIYPVSEVNQLGMEYSLLPSGTEKEAKLLDLIQRFHNYLMKYVTMIKEGHLPQWQGKVSRDTENMLRYFVPRGQPVNKATLSAACRTLHLAFKQMDSDEVYDVLVQCFLKSVAKYDPRYTEKMAEVIRLLNSHSTKHRFARLKNIYPSKLNAYLDFDCTRLLRLLVRRGYLEPHSKLSAKGVKQLYYRRTSEWPPPPSFMTAGPIGMTYFVQRWFKYFLQEWIDRRMSEIESKDGVFQLEHRLDYSDSSKARSIHDMAMPHLNGNLTGHDGRTWAADLSLMEKNQDLSEINLDWVLECQDKLFSTLSVMERHLLHLFYVKEIQWAEIAATFELSVPEVKRWHQSIVHKLKAELTKPPDPKAPPEEPDDWMDIPEEEVEAA